MVYEDGSHYEGHWVNGVKQGKGVERNNIKGAGNKEFSGLFENNDKVGPDWNIVTKNYAEHAAIVYRPTNLKYIPLESDL